MRRALVVLAAVALVVVGCGGKRKPGSIQPPIRTQPAGPDAGEKVMDAFVRAAGRGDAKALWQLLSRPSQRRLGSFAPFRKTTAIELSEGVGSFARAKHKAVVSERVTDSFGVVAIAGFRRAEGTREYAAYATALRLEHGAWHVELGGGPVQIEPLGPLPGSHQARVIQVGAEVRTGAKPPDLETGVMWLDGIALNAELHGGARSATFFANLASPLARGRHNVVVFAGGAEDASATAWTFWVP
jgi:hypothetical protein